MFVQQIKKREVFWVCLIVKWNCKMKKNAEVLVFFSSFHPSFLSFYLVISFFLAHVPLCLTLLFLSSFFFYLPFLIPLFHPSFYFPSFPLSTFSSLFPSFPHFSLFSFAFCFLPYSSLLSLFPCLTGNFLNIFFFILLPLWCIFAKFSVCSSAVWSMRTLRLWVAWLQLWMSDNRTREGWVHSYTQLNVTWTSSSGGILG